MATIKDVAREAGVTTATVSYVLNGTGRVSEATRQKVLTAARKLKYRPSVIAQNLRAGESRIVGFAWHTDPGDEWIAVKQQFLYHLSVAVERAGYHVLTFIADADDPVQSYVSLFDSGWVDGFVLAPVQPGDPRVARLLELEIPFVAFGRTQVDLDVPRVGVDDAHGIALAVTHLVERGHRRIGFMTWPDALPDANHAEGYRRALAAAGIVPDERWSVAAQNTPEDGFRAAQQLLALPAEIRPTAIACASDTLAAGVMRYAAGAGIAVGRDLAVTGYGDLPAAALLTPPLTSVRAPLDMIAEWLVALLLDRLYGTAEYERHLLLEPSLVMRASSDPDRVDG